MKKTVMVFIFLYLGNIILNAQGFKPNVLPHLKAMKISHAIKIDGVLEEAEWGKIKAIDNFVETNPGDLVKPPVQTLVKVAYDKANLYLAFYCKDNPDNIRVSLTERDNIFQDDYIGAIIDTYGNASWAVFVASNAIGIQGDTRISSSSGEDVNYDLIYRSAGRIVKDGYVVEMAIPFSSLRFPTGDEQEWRINFWRTHPRDSRRTYSWAAINRDDPCFLCQMGFLEGIKWIKPSRSMELLPSFVANKSGELTDFEDPHSGFKSKDIMGSASLGFKWAITPSLTMEATVNPDFSQVESDADQIDVNNNFALFFPEKRPFFQEGSDLFRTRQQVVYTRSINDPVAATKIIGRWRKTTLAFLSAVDDRSLLILPFQEKTGYAVMERNLNNIIRVKHALGKSSYIGALMTDRRYKMHGSNSVAGVDGEFRFGKAYKLEFQFLASRITEPDDSTLTDDLSGEYFDKGQHSAVFDGETYSGNTVSIALVREGRHFSADMDFRQVSPTFRADNGFIFQNDTRMASVWMGYQIYPDNRIFDRISPNINIARKWNYRGTVKDQWVSPALNINFKQQTFFNIGYLFNSERYKNRDLHDINRLMMNINSNFSDRVKAGIGIFKGRFVANRNDSIPVRGTGNNINFWASFKPLNNLSIIPEFAFQDMVRLDNDETVFSGYILRIRSQYQFNKELYLRFIFQYNDFSNHFSLEPLISYQINPFTIFYAGSSLGYENYDSAGWANQSRQYFMKIQYLVSL